MPKDFFWNPGAFIEGSGTYYEVLMTYVKVKRSKHLCEASKDQICGLNHRMQAS